VQQDDGGTIGWTGFGVAVAQPAGFDLFDAVELCAAAGDLGGRCARLLRAALPLCGGAEAKFGSGEREGGCGEEAAAVLVDL